MFPGEWQELKHSWVRAMFTGMPSLVGMSSSKSVSSHHSKVGFLNIIITFEISQKKKNQTLNIVQFNNSSLIFKHTMSTIFISLHIIFLQNKNTR